MARKLSKASSADYPYQTFNATPIDRAIRAEFCDPPEMRHSVGPWMSIKSPRGLTIDPDKFIPVPAVGDWVEIDDNGTKMVVMVTKHETLKKGVVARLDS